MTHEVMPSDTSALVSQTPPIPHNMRGLLQTALRLLQNEAIEPDLFFYITDVLIRGLCTESGLNMLLLDMLLPESVRVLQAGMTRVESGMLTSRTLSELATGVGRAYSPTLVSDMPRELMSVAQDVISTALDLFEQGTIEAEDFWRVLSLVRQMHYPHPSIRDESLLGELQTLLDCVDSSVVPASVLRSWVIDIAAFLTAARNVSTEDDETAKAGATHTQEVLRGDVPAEDTQVKGHETAQVEDIEDADNEEVKAPQKTSPPLDPDVEETKAKSSGEAQQAEEGKAEEQQVEEPKAKPQQVEEVKTKSSEEPVQAEQVKHDPAAPAAGNVPADCVLYNIPTRILSKQSASSQKDLGFCAPNALFLAPNSHHLFDHRDPGAYEKFLQDLRQTAMTYDGTEQETHQNNLAEDLSEQAIVDLEIAEGSTYRFSGEQLVRFANLRGVRVNIYQMAGYGTELKDVKLFDLNHPDMPPTSPVISLWRSPGAARGHYMIWSLRGHTPPARLVGAQGSARLGVRWTPGVPDYMACTYMSEMVTLYGTSSQDGEQRDGGKTACEEPKPHSSLPKPSFTEMSDADQSFGKMSGPLKRPESEILEITNQEHTPDPEDNLATKTASASNKDAAMFKVFAAQELFELIVEASPDGPSSARKVGMTCRELHKIVNKQMAHFGYVGGERCGFRSMQVNPETGAIELLRNEQFPIIAIIDGKQPLTAAYNGYIPISYMQMMQALCDTIRLEQLRVLELHDLPFLRFEHLEAVLSRLRVLRSLTVSGCPRVTLSLIADAEFLTLLDIRFEDMEDSPTDRQVRFFKLKQYLTVLNLDASQELSEWRPRYPYNQQVRESAAFVAYILSTFKDAKFGGMLDSHPEFTDPNGTLLRSIDKFFERYCSGKSMSSLLLDFLARFPVAGMGRTDSAGNVPSDMTDRDYEEELPEEQYFIRAEAKHPDLKAHVNAVMGDLDRELRRCVGYNEASVMGKAFYCQEHGFLPPMCFAKEQLKNGARLSDNNNMRQCQECALKDVKALRNYSDESEVWDRGDLINDHHKTTLDVPQSKKSNIPSRFLMEDVAEDEEDYAQYQECMEDVTRSRRYDLRGADLGVSPAGQPLRLIRTSVDDETKELVMNSKTLASMASRDSPVVKREIKFEFSYNRPCPQVPDSAEVKDYVVHEGKKATLAPPPPATASATASATAPATAPGPTPTCAPSGRASRPLTAMSFSSATYKDHPNKVLYATQKPCPSVDSSKDLEKVSGEGEDSKVQEGQEVDESSEKAAEVPVGESDEERGESNPKTPISEVTETDTPKNKSPLSFKELFHMHVKPRFKPKSPEQDRAKTVDTIEVFYADKGKISSITTGTIDEASAEAVKNTQSRPKTIRDFADHEICPSRLRYGDHSTCDCGLGDVVCGTKACDGSCEKAHFFCNEFLDGECSRLMCTGDHDQRWIEVSDRHARARHFEEMAKKLDQ